MTGGDKVLVWDRVVRGCHLILVVVFFSNYFINEQGETVHIALGYLAVSAVVVRLVWGFVSQGAARWSAFFPTPARLGVHWGLLWSRQPWRGLGHSPIGALVMITMLSLVVGLVATGVMMTEVDRFWGEEWLQDLHERCADLLAALVALHVTAAVVESRALRENLVVSMLTGTRKASEVGKLQTPDREPPR